MSRKRRLVLASGANGLALVARVAQQLLLVPILLSAWSPALYGEWLMLSAIPVYLSLSDMGFVTAGSNELTRRAQDGVTEDVKAFFSDYISVYALFSLALAVVFALLAWVLPLPRWLGLEVISPAEARTAFILLAFSALVSQNALTLQAGLRAVRAVHMGFGLMAVFAFVQIAAVFVATVLCDAGPVGAVVGILATQLSLVAAQSLALRRFSLPPRWRLLRKPAAGMGTYFLIGLEFVLFPLAQALVLQGSLLVVGKLFGAVLVTAFSTHRTLTRMVSQVVQLGSTPLRAEAGLLQDGKHQAELRKLVMSISRLTLWGSIALGAGLMLLGPWFFGGWTHGAVAFMPVLFLLLILATVFEGQWRVASAPRLGSNRHRPLAWSYLAIALIGLAAMGPTGPVLGLAGICFILAGMDAAMLVVALAANRSILGLPVWQSLRETIRFPRAELRGVMDKLARVGRK